VSRFFLQFLFETFLAPVTNKPITRLSVFISTQKGKAKAEWEMDFHSVLETQFRAPDDERCAARNMLSIQ
jgi:hypothetical protein